MLLSPCGGIIDFTSFNFTPFVRRFMIYVPVLRTHLPTKVNHIGVGVIEGQEHSIARVHLIDGNGLVHVLLWRRMVTTHRFRHKQHPNTFIQKGFIMNVVFFLQLRNKESSKTQIRLNNLMKANIPTVWVKTCLLVNSCNVISVLLCSRGRAASHSCD